MLTPPESIETQRLVLRLVDPSNAEALSKYHLDNQDRFAPYCPKRPIGYHSEAAWVERALAQRESMRAGQTIHWLIFSRDQSNRDVVAHIGFTAIQRGVAQCAYLGYGLDRASEGKGLMREALCAALADVFERANLHRVMANYVPTNERSGRLLRRLGFNVEGYARDYLLLDGVWKDHILTALSNPRWKAE
ncbi:MAG TPA: GNAT family N-acetyltransferase [Polyangiaceae bacterium]